MSVRTIVLFAIAALAVGWLGCSKSSTTQGSSGSLSDSSSSPFDSSSSSSDDDDNEADEAFRRDVTGHTAAFASVGGDPRAFERALGTIAEAHGVTDWESRMDTYRAIGSGLAKADLDTARYEQLAIALAGERHERLAAIGAGYRGTAYTNSGSRAE